MGVPQTQRLGEGVGVGEGSTKAGRKDEEGGSGRVGGRRAGPFPARLPPGPLAWPLTLTSSLPLL